MPVAARKRLIVPKGRGARRSRGAAGMVTARRVRGVTLIVLPPGRRETEVGRRKWGVSSGFRLAPSAWLGGPVLLTKSPGLLQTLGHAQTGAARASVGSH